MGKKVSVDTDRLRDGARKLSTGAHPPQVPAFTAGDFGSARADAGFVEFDRYWSTGRSALTQNTDALVTVLRSVASTAAERDADSARGFRAGAHAF